MSSYGAPDCPICGAHADYCTLTTATGVDVDCRFLELRDPRDAEWIQMMWLRNRRLAREEYQADRDSRQDIASDAT